MPCLKTFVSEPFRLALLMRSSTTRKEKRQMVFKKLVFWVI
jgi:hypothetical protein